MQFWGKMKIFQSRSTALSYFIDYFKEKFKNILIRLKLYISRK